MTRNADEAVAAASVIGFPVVLKAIGPMLLHKTERQAVRLNLDSEEAVRSAALDFEERFRGELTGLLVQQMVDGRRRDAGRCAARSNLWPVGRLR